jgi:hypothetical protein
VGHGALAGAQRTAQAGCPPTSGPAPWLDRIDDERWLRSLLAYLRRRKIPEATSPLPPPPYSRLQDYPLSPPELMLFTPAPHPNVSLVPLGGGPLLLRGAQRPRWRLALFDCVPGHSTWSSAYSVLSVLVQLQGEWLGRAAAGLQPPASCRLVGGRAAAARRAAPDLAGAWAARSLSVQSCAAAAPLKGISFLGRLARLPCSFPAAGGLAVRYDQGVLSGGGCPGAGPGLHELRPHGRAAPACLPYSRGHQQGLPSGRQVS